MMILEALYGPPKCCSRNISPSTEYRICSIQSSEVTCASITAFHYLLREKMIIVIFQILCIIGRYPQQSTTAISSDPIMCVVRYKEAVNCGRRCSPSQLWHWSLRSIIVSVRIKVQILSKYSSLFTWKWLLYIVKYTRMVYKTVYLLSTIYRTVYYQLPATHKVEESDPSSGRTTSALCSCHETGW